MIIIGKIKFYIIISILLIVLGMFIPSYITNRNNYRNEISVTGPVLGEQIVNVREIIQKLKLKEVAVNQIRQKQELIVMETDLEQDIRWDDSWGDFDIFKKFQEINFYARGIYTVNLDTLMSQDIEFNYSQNKILIHTPKPTIKSIEIQEEKTTYKTTEKGLLRFGDITLTPAQNQMLTQQIKSQMKEKMNSSELYSQALESAQTSIKDLINKIVGNLKTYNENMEIEVIFK